MDNNYLIKEKEGKLLLKFSIPCILSLLIAALYNIVDQIFIGNAKNVGAIGNTATTIVYPLTVICLAFGLMFGDGAASLMSLESGKGEGAKNHKIVGNSILCGIIVSIVLLLICFPLLTPILKFFGTNTKNPDLYLEFGVKAIRIYLMLITLTLLGKVTAIYLQASNSPLKAAFLSLLRDIITVVPAMFILPISLGLDGVLWAAPVADIITAIVTITFIILEYKKLNKLIKEKNL